MPGGYGELMELVGVYNRYSIHEIHAYTHAS
jgi:hypothetical protein